MDEKKEQPIAQLSTTHLTVFDYVSTRYDALIGIGQKPEDLLNPAFWAHHAVKLKPMDEIRARAEDGTWMGHYLVLDCSRTWAKVKELNRWSLGTSDVALTQASQEEFKAFVAQHKIVHRGPHKWSVVRNGDSAVISEGHVQRGDAEKALDKYARAQIGVEAKAPAPAASVPA